MTRLFMLEFNYEGERYFANVIEYRHSPAVYYVNLINAPHMRPRKLILEDVEGGIELSPDSLPARKGFVEVIARKIGEYVKSHGETGQVG
jgi:hypothetical protein